MRSLTFLRLLFASYSLFAQSKVDSLYQIWINEDLPDTVRLEVINTVIWNGYLFNNPDSALLLADAEYEIAARNDELGYMAQARNSQGSAYYVLGNHPMALDYFMKCAKIQEKIDSKLGLSRTYNNIGIIHKEQEDFDQAMKYYKLSYNLGEELPDTSTMATALNNIGINHKHEGRFQEALDAFEKSLVLKETLGSQKGIAITLLNIGETHFQLGRKDEALNYYQRSLAIREEIEDDFGRAACLANIAGIKADYGQFALAENLAKEALEIGQKLDALEPMESSSKVLLDVYRKTGQNQKALEMYDVYINTRDTLRSEANSKKILQQQLKYDYDKKTTADSLRYEKEIAVQELTFQAQLDRERNQRFMLYGGLGFLGILGMVSFRAYRQKQRDNILIESEKEKSDKLLLNILPKETAEELKAHGKAKARHFSDVSVMFTDFKGFTQLAEKLSAQELVDQLDYCFGKFDEITAKHEVEKIKTIGDAYMCAAGLPKPDSRHASRIVKVAQDIRAFMKDYRDAREAAGKPFFEVRIGIHSGPAVAGIVGTKKFAYDIWGDTINTASRMESSGTPGNINISEATYQKIKDDFNCKYRGEIEAKNKGKLKMYFVE
ncbi:MAG: tetratricopeptide repeat protein [Bacteroidetes bacterium]|nr:tetratricopeptide repeat protein [Bacteroidota bacterium]